MTDLMTIMLTTIRDVETKSRRSKIGRWTALQFTYKIEGERDTEEILACLQ